MTPKEKAEELCMKFYSRIEHTLSEEYSPHERFITKQCALIAVDEILRSHHNLYGVNNKQVKFFLEVQQEIEKIGGQDEN